MLEYRPQRTFNFVESRWYKHIREQLCAGDEMVFNYVMAWIAHLIQYPEEIPCVAILFSTAEGNGKDLLAKFVSRLISSRTPPYDNPDQFFSKFNAGQEQSLLIVLNEIKDKGEAFYKHDQLKSFITRDDKLVEPKGKMRTQQRITLDICYSRTTIIRLILTILIVDSA